MKGIAIWLVVYGHSLQYFGCRDFINNDMVRFIYSFHMPLFMILCGFFFQSSLKHRFVSFFQYKFMQLIFPTILWGIMFEAINALINNHLKTSIIYDICSNFWFLKCLFINYILFYVLSKILKSAIMVLIIAILISLILPSSFNFQFMLPFFGFGILLNKYRQQFEVNIKLITGLSFLTFIICFIFWKGSYTIYFSPFYVNFNPLKVIGASVMLFRMIIGLSGSIAIIGLSYLLYSPTTVSKYISSIGQFTLSIYILQTFIVEAFLSQYIDIQMPNILYTYFIVPIISLVILMGIFLLVRELHKYKILKKYFFGNIQILKEIL